MEGEAEESEHKKVKGIRSTNWQLQNCHGDVQYRIRNTVGNIVITLYGAGRGTRFIRGLFVSYRNV